MIPVDISNLRNRIAASKAATGYQDRQFVDVPTHMLEDLLKERDKHINTLTGAGYVNKGGEQWKPPSEEELVQIMVEADDGLAGFERCRHMLRAVMKKLKLTMLP